MEPRTEFKNTPSNAARFFLEELKESEPDWKTGFDFDKAKISFDSQMSMTPDTKPLSVLYNLGETYKRMNVTGFAATLVANGEYADSNKARILSGVAANLDLGYYKAYDVQYGGKSTETVRLEKLLSDVFEQKPSTSQGEKLG
ncbi:MAG TPA: hypothetical protein VL401_00750 [Alphaproteobacteria bacterium]|jgi:hypothetical protein|nr:hypothetical protein [Alphaproteobacteria bacterium]